MFDVSDPSDVSDTYKKTRSVHEVSMMAQEKQRGVSAVVVIPARYASTRLPGKPLLRDTGKYLIQHTYEAASAAKRASQVIVATDDQRILRAVEEFGGRGVMTSPDCASGTDRIAEAVRAIDCDVVVNVQGDEPMLPASHIDAIIEMFDEDAALEMATLAVPLRDADAAMNPNMVKVVTDATGYALYFSRSPIPFYRDGIEEKSEAFLKHLGIYGYRREFLMKFVSWPQSRLEKAERLEQLRALENGARIRVGIVRQDTISIDTREDYAQFARKWLDAHDRRPKTGV